MKHGRFAGKLLSGTGTLLGFAALSAAQAPGIEDCTVDACSNGEGYAIQIIGYTDDRPPGPFDTPVARENDNRVDVSGEFLVRLPGGGTIWATEDPAVMDPRIAVHTADTFAVANGRLAAPIRSASSPGSSPSSASGTSTRGSRARRARTRASRPTWPASSPAFPGAPGWR